MCMWVRAMHKYHQVSVMVEPKKAAGRGDGRIGGDDAEARRFAPEASSRHRRDAPSDDVVVGPRRATAASSRCVSRVARRRNDRCPAAIVVDRRASLRGLRRRDATSDASVDATLTEAQAKLKAVMDKLERLEKEFNEANDKKLQLQRDVEECAARLERAKKLIGGLGGERTRWTESCASLELSYAKLVGDALISAATIAYTGPLRHF